MSISSYFHEALLIRECKIELCKFQNSNENQKFMLQEKHWKAAADAAYPVFMKSRFNELESSNDNITLGSY